LLNKLFDGCWAGGNLAIDLLIGAQRRSSSPASFYRDLLAILAPKLDVLRVPLSNRKAG
jgi:hypothetical protein